MVDSKRKTINFATAYRQPFHALYQGKPVRVLATGDVEGMSPSLQYCDEQGKIDWAPESEFTVVDQNSLPGADITKLIESANRSSREPVGSRSGSY